MNVRLDHISGYAEKTLVSEKNRDTKMAKNVHCSIEKARHGYQLRLVSNSSPPKLEDLRPRWVRSP